MKRNRKWTEKQVDILCKLYPDHTNEEIASLVKHTPRAVGAKACSLGLHKDKDWMLSQTMKTAFKKGYTPYSKGKTWDELYTKEHQEKLRANLYQPGRTPHNKVPIGHERKPKNGYWLVKVAEPNVFRPKHHILWEQHYGPIPKGCVISFIDGNPNNITIGNLRKETKREKFFRCGCIHTSVPAELKEMAYLKGALKRQINKIEKRNGNK